MRKLAIAALSFSAAIFSANYILPQAFLLQIGITFAVLAAVLFAAGRKKLRPFAVVLLFFSIGLACFDLHNKSTAQQAEAQTGQVYAIEAQILTYPQIYEDYCRFEVRVISGGLPKLKAYLYDNDMQLMNAKPGDYVSLNAKITAANTLYGKEYRNYYANGIYLKLSSVSEIMHKRGGFDVFTLPQHLSHWLSSRIEYIFPDDTQIFMRSLMLGDKSDFYGDEALYAAMSRAGLMHIVAVSGMHISFLLSLLYHLLGKGKRSAIICVVCVWTFALVAGATPSVIRAAFMCSTMLMAPVLQRENDAITSLSLALALLLCQNPFAAASISLQLSFSAMAGIVIFGSKLYALLIKKAARVKHNFIVRSALRSISSSLSVMVFTVPLTALHFGTVPILAPLTNLISLWAVSLCFCGGWISCALSAVPFLGEISAWICSWFARYIFFAAELISSVPFAVIYSQTSGLWIWMVVSYGLLGLLAWTKLGYLCRIIIPLTISFAFLIGLSFYNCNKYNAYSSITVLDVGQGQCVSVLTEQASVVFDCGNIYSIDNAGEIAASYLHSRGRGELDLLLLSHMHGDHANGAIMLMETMQVNAIVIPAECDDNERQYDDIVASAERNGTKIITIDADTELKCGDVSISIYCGGISGEENERCLMFIADFDGAQLLITGDATVRMQQQLSEKVELATVDAVVVPHHGSKYSLCEELLAKIGGDIALISVGHNYFGHPAEETLEALRYWGYNVYRTDLQGNLIIGVGQ